MKNVLKKILFIIPILLLILLTSDVAAQSTDVNVRVNAPEYVSDEFEVMIDIENVINLDCGGFDLSFDNSVMNTIEVKPGSIGNVEIPIDAWEYMDNNTIRILFNLPGADGISGSGYLTKIAFKVVGNIGETSILDLSDTTNKKRTLVNIEPERINTNWLNGNVEVGSSTSTTVPVVENTYVPVAIATSTQITHSDPILKPTDIVQNGESKEPETKTDFNYIIVYSFIGLIVFIYTIIMLR